MDDHTLKNGTVVLVKWEMHTYLLDPNGGDGDDNEKNEFTWLWFRVPGSQASDQMEHVAAIWFDDLIVDFGPEDDRLIDFEEELKKEKERSERRKREAEEKEKDQAGEGEK